MVVFQMLCFKLFVNSLIDYNDSYTTIVPIKIIDAGITSAGDLIDFETFKYNPSLVISTY